MKYLFLIAAVALVLASLGLRSSFPDLQADSPVIYWVTDRNPARELQVEQFHQWLIENGHVDEEGKPVVELRLDTDNGEGVKKVIQSVSGVAGDLMDTSAEQMRLMAAMGVINDFTADADAHGYGTADTWPAVESAIAIDGRQYRYPANVTVNGMYWVNGDTFRRFGMEPPKGEWTWADFERLGLEFREKANPPGTPPYERRFIADGVDIVDLMRSSGLSQLNETMTASHFNDPRYIDTLNAIKRWTYELNIIPTPDDQDAYSSSQGYGGARLQLFGSGQYAMVRGGRYLLIQFRRFSGLNDLSIIPPPSNGFTCASMLSRAVVLYEGGKHRELSKLFLEYLASERYNQVIVEDADALPPNPKYTQTEAFLRPANRPNEWGVHEAFAQAAETIAVVETLSPYILPSVLGRQRNYYRDQMLLGKISAEDAAHRTAMEIDRQIQEDVARKPELKEAYDRDFANQKIIDQCKLDGKPIPASLVTNPFYLAYYEHQNMLQHDEASSKPAADSK